MENYNSIFKNVTSACKMLKRRFANIVRSIVENEFCILGLDIVVNNLNEIFVIEVNPRPNLKHDGELGETVSTPLLKDSFKLLVDNTYLEETDFVEI